MKDLIKASDIQPEDDRARAMARKHEAEVSAAIVAVLAGIGDLYDTTAIAAILRALDRRKLDAVIDDQKFQDLIVTGYTPIADTFIDAGRTEANDNLRGLLGYDPLTAMLPLQDLRKQLALTLSDSARAAVSDALADTIRSGVSPEIIAQRLRGVVGLDTQDQRAVANYRRMLQTGDSTALRRALRDERYDEVVRRANQAGSTLKPEQIEALVEARIKKGLEHRAQTIAKTETMQAAVSGIRSPYVQAVDSGKLYDSEVKRYWLTAADELVCPICRSIPILNRKGIGVNDEYKSIDGYYDAPLAHPRCRCSERYVTNLSRLTEQPFAEAA